MNREQNLSEIKEALDSIVAYYKDGVSFYSVYNALNYRVKSYLAINFEVDCAEDFEIFMSGYYFNM